MTRSKFLSFPAALVLGTFLLLATGAAPAQTTLVTPRGQEAVKRPAAAPHDFARWEKEIAAYEASDRASPPPKGGTLFIGSSTIRLWKSLAEDFPDYKVINRGFGGSEIADSTHFADRIIFPYEPKQIFLRAGGNDIHAGRLPEEVAADFADFVRVVHGRLLNTEIVYIAVNPAPALGREQQVPRAQQEDSQTGPAHAPRQLRGRLRREPRPRRTGTLRTLRRRPAPFQRRRLQAPGRPGPALFADDEVIAAMVVAVRGAPVNDSAARCDRPPRTIPRRSRGPAGRTCGRDTRAPPCPGAR